MVVELLPVLLLEPSSVLLPFLPSSLSILLDVVKLPVVVVNQPSLVLVHLDESPSEVVVALFLQPPPQLFHRSFPMVVVVVVVVVVSLFFDIELVVL